MNIGNFEIIVQSCSLFNMYTACQPQNKSYFLVTLQVILEPNTRRFCWAKVFSACFCSELLFSFSFLSKLA